MSGRAVQRVRLGLLALLATTHTRGRGVGREKLVGYLWPEAEGDRGRHLLSDSVYRINSAVGGEAILATGDELRLNPKEISSDVMEFESAIDAGDHERAVSLYAGALLDGVFLVDGSEFERWVDGERTRLAAEYAKSLDELAEAADRRGDRSAAVGWWRKLAGHDPYSSRVALRLMQSLAASGDSAAALRHAVIHTTLLREELGTAPNAAVSDLAERLKADPAAVSGELATTPLPLLPVVPADQLVHVPNVAREAVHTGAISESRRQSRLPRFLGLAVLVAALLVVAGLLLWWRPASVPTPPAASIAVLPFTDLSPARDNAYFSDGMTEELINTLTQVEGMHVAARTSVFAYKDRQVDVREVGRSLGVATVLEGSVRKSGDKIRITAQLANAADGYQLWSESYDREMNDVFSIQEDISRAIVNTLRGRLVGSTPVQIAERSTQDADAYDLYLKGRYAWHQRTEYGLRRATEYFQQAVTRAPNYARAYVGLADAYAVLGFYDYLSPRESFPRAEEAAKRALAIDSMLAAPYATLGYVELYYHWNWAAAEVELEKSIAIDPSYSTAHQWYANLLTATGRFGEAEQEMRIAQERDPLSLIANAALGWTFYYAGDFARAIAQCDRTLELNREFQLAHLWKGWALEAANQPREALASIEQAVQRGQTTLSLLSLAHALASAGSQDSAKRIVTAIEAARDTGYAPAYEIGKVYLALNARDDAMRWLERAFDERSHSMAFLKVDPQLRRLRGDPGFERLVARVNEKK